MRFLPFKYSIFTITFTNNEKIIMLREILPALQRPTGLNSHNIISNKIVNIFSNIYV